MKTCKKCGETKALTEFGKKPGNRDGLKGSCKICIALQDQTRNRTKDGKIKQLYQTMKESCKKRSKKENKTYTVNFTLDEFTKWCYENRFDSYHWSWLMNNYKKDFAPSVDRKDDYDGYNFDNMRMCFWKDNREKYYKDTKSGKTNKQNSKVYQYDLNKNLINEYHSHHDAARQNEFNRGHISSCCRNEYCKRKNVYNNFIWSSIEL